jgi:hypothetical protein
LVGAVIMLVALVAVPGPWWRGYVSEAGTESAPLAGAYRCGLILLAAGVGLLALGLRRRRIPVAAAVLGVADVLAATSGAVPCSHRCPLPPYEPTTAADVVHAAASILGMMLLAGAMALVAVSPLRRSVRRLAAAAVAIMVPLGGTLGLIMLLRGRSTTGAALERILLAIAVAWLIGTSVLLAGEPRPSPRDWSRPDPGHE